MKDVRVLGSRKLDEIRMTIIEYKQIHLEGNIIGNDGHFSLSKCDWPKE